MKEPIRNFLKGRGGRTLVSGLAYLLGLVFLTAGVSMVIKPWSPRGNLRGEKVKFKNEPNKVKLLVFLTVL